MDSAKRQALELERDRLRRAANEIDRLLVAADRRAARQAQNTSECLRVIDQVVTVYRNTFPVHHMDRDRLMFGGERASCIPARMVAMYLLKFYFKMSYPEIGRVFGKDHSSCLYMAKKCIDAISVPTDEWRLMVACLDYFGFAPAHPMHGMKVAT